MLMMCPTQYHLCIPNWWQCPGNSVAGTWCVRAVDYSWKYARQHYRFSLGGHRDCARNRWMRTKSILSVFTGIRDNVETIIYSGVMQQNLWNYCWKVLPEIPKADQCSQSSQLAAFPCILAKVAVRKIAEMCGWHATTVYWNDPLGKRTWWLRDAWCAVVSADWSVN